MNKSLQRRLSVWLSVAIVTTGVLAAGVSFLLAREDGKDLQDHMLKQIALLVARNPGISMPNDLPREGHRPYSIKNSEAKITVLRLPGDKRPDWLPENLRLGAHTFATDEGHIRAYLLSEHPGLTTVVAQPTHVRDEIALNSSLIELISLFMLLPLMVWLTLRLVKRQFAPVNQLASHLDAQEVDRPTAIADKEIPNEIIPFVQAINRMLGRVDDLLNQQRRFIANAAHELRSPLTALSVQAQNLQQSETLDSVRERVVPLLAGVERARKLTEQLLNLARTSAEKDEVAEVNISILVRELIAESLVLSEGKHIDLGLAEQASLRWNTVPGALRLLLRNALENALKYTPYGGEVTVRIYSNDDNDVIEVIDNGPGIPDSEKKHVFEPFYRIPGTTGAGSGLGLAIAKEASISLGGSLALDNRPDGSGLVFSYRQTRSPRAEQSD